MHIVIVARGVPTPHYPLNGIFEWDQAKALAAAGVNVDFLAVDLRSFRRFRPWGIVHGKTDGVRWHSFSIPLGPMPLWLFCKIGTIALRKLFRNVFRNDDSVPDVIHAHFTEMGYMTSELVKEERTPFIITEHSSLMMKSMVSDELKRIARESYHSAACVIAVSASLKKSIYQHTGIVAEVLPNIVSAEFRYGRREHLGMKFISVATLVYGKRIEILLRAFERLSLICKDVTLEIVGDGEQRKFLKKLAEELHVSDKITFHGILSRQDIDALYKTCDCFVLPSAFETFGVAYIEAMAAGLPVIATRCGGPEDFVTNENGILVDADDVDGLKDAMLTMYLAREKYNGEAISERTKAEYSASAIAGRLLNIYEDVLEKRD